LAPVEAAVATPRLAIPVILVWFAVAAWRRLWATPVAVLVAAALIVATAPSGLGAAFAWPVPVLVTPAFDVGALVGIALPLFLVTMASQNLPGLAVLDANGYRTAPGPLIATTGAFSLVSAPFGAHAVNLAAITAALCAGPDADPDPAKRWQAGVSCGLAYVALGLLAGVAVALAGAAPPVLIEAVAGLALLGALGASLQAALVPADSREAALMAFLVTASGVAILGIGGAFWGLVAGGAASGFARLTRRG
ncbi:MAG: benzoate/H(+) symporter BenE family transporter, partial [Hyphomicrobiales bacterium]|nr:benzoate/H(+) symporter BenE family transporter [Hyphomicrobiales bacterium]